MVHHGNIRDQMRMEFGMSNVIAKGYEVSSNLMSNWLRWSPQHKGNLLLHRDRSRRVESCNGGGELFVAYSPCAKARR